MPGAVAAEGVDTLVLSGRNTSAARRARGADVPGARRGSSAGRRCVHGARRRTRDRRRGTRDRARSRWRRATGATTTSPVIPDSDHARADRGGVGKTYDAAARARTSPSTSGCSAACRSISARRPRRSSRPTSASVARKRATTPQLAALYFQYARYLLIVVLAPRHAARESAGHLERQARPRRGARSTRSTSTPR